MAASPWSMPALATLLVVAIGLSGGAMRASADECPNQAIRAEQNATSLPECRAYELVTPGAPLGQEGFPARAAVDGGAITYYTTHPSASATASNFIYLARRGPDGWTNGSVGPQNVSGVRFESVCEQNVFFSPDLTANILEAGRFDAGEPARCKRPEEIVPGEPDPYRNVFVQRPGSPTQLVNLTPEGATPANARFQDASTDLSRVVFGEEAQLTPDAPPGYDFYIWNEGTVRLLTVLPDGSPSTGELAEATSRPGALRSGFAPFTGAMSDDGRRVFFYGPEGLYLREDAEQPQSAIVAGHCTEPGRACTTQVDASHGPGPDGGGVFWRATPSGSTVFFTDTSRLTADSTAAPGKPDLYRYETGSGQLTDLTVNAGEAADVLGLSGIGTDGSRVYFVADGALAPGAAPGNCPGTTKAPGSCNLYLLDGSSITFVATLTEEDRLAWQENPEATVPIQKAGRLWANVSPNGRYLAFIAYEPLTGYDNTDAENSSEPDPEIFVYDAGSSGGLTCASCPSGPARYPNLNLGSATNYSPDGGGASWMTHAVLDDGSVFFSSPAPLVPADENESEDVYQYLHGKLSLISPGNLDVDAHFLDASANGEDVFFRTPQALVGADQDEENISLYDARREGGFAEPPAPPPPCTAEDCRGPITAAPVPSPLGVAAPEPLGRPTKPLCRKKRRGRCQKHSARHRAGKKDGRRRHRRAGR